MRRHGRGGTVRGVLAVLAVCVALVLSVVLGAALVFVLAPVLPRLLG